MNYGELKELMGQYLEATEQSFVENIPEFIRLAEEDIFRQVQLQDLMETATANMFANDKYLALPADFLSIYSLGVRDGTGQFSYMLSKDHSFINECYPDPTERGVPRFYALFNAESLILGPTPDLPYEVQINYFYFPPSITDGDDSNETWLSREAENALLFGSVLQGYVYLKGDQDVVASYTNQYQTALASLKIIAEGRNRKDSYRKSDRRIPV